MSTPHILIDQYMNYLLVEKGLAQNTLEAYGKDLGAFTDFLQERKIDDLTQADTPDIVQHLIGLRAQGLGARTRARHLVTIRGLFSFLEQEKIIKYNPAKLVDLPKTGLHLPDVISVEEIEQLLEAPNEMDALGARDRAMMELAYASGLRVSELIHVKVQDIHLDAGFVRVYGQRLQGAHRAHGQAGQGKDQILHGSRPAHPLERQTGRVFVRGPGRTAHDPSGLLEIVEEVRSKGRINQEYHAPHFAAFLRQPPFGGRRGPSGGSGNAWAR